MGHHRDDGLPRAPAWMRAAGGGRCVVCGQPLGKEDFWMTHYPDGTHTRCMDWESRGYPFTRNLTHLRKVRRTVARALREIDLVGKALAAGQRRWPKGGAALVAELDRSWRQLVNALSRVRESMKL